MEYSKTYNISELAKGSKEADRYIYAQSALVKALRVVPIKSGNMRRSIQIKIDGMKLMVFINETYYKKGQEYYKFTNELKNYRSYGWWDKFLKKFEANWNRQEKKLISKTKKNEETRLTKALAETMSPQTIKDVVATETKANVDKLIIERNGILAMNVLVAERIKKENLYINGLAVVFLLKLVKKEIREQNNAT